MGTASSIASMGLKPVRRRRQAAPQDRMEDQSVRQYRYLLRTAPPDALEEAHIEALNELGQAQRRLLLDAVQASLMAGAHLKADDVRSIGHLITLGERRTPGALIAAVPEATLVALSVAVIHSEPTFGLFGGYAAWDGRDPEPPQERDDSEFGEAWHTRLLGHDDTAVWRSGG